MDVLSPHLRGIVIAGGLAGVGLALGFSPLAMTPASSSAPHTVLSLKARHLSGTKAASPTAKPVKRKPLNAHLVAALKLGLPRSVARGLATHRVTVVALTSSSDSVAVLAKRETEAGAKLGGASFVRVSVDRDGGDAWALTALIGKLPAAPATLVYVRPGTLFVQMPGFNDKTTVQQAVHTALQAPAGSTAAPAPAATAPTTTTPAATAPTATAAARPPRPPRRERRSFSSATRARKDARLLSCARSTTGRSASSRPRSIRRTRSRRFAPAPTPSPTRVRPSRS